MMLNRIPFSLVHQPVQRQWVTVCSRRSKDCPHVSPVIWFIFLVTSNGVYRAFISGVWGQRHQSVSCMCVSYWGYCSYCEIQSRHLLPSYVTLRLFSFWAFDYWAEELRTEGVSFQFSSSSSSMRNQCQSVVLCGKRKKLLECLVYW